MIGNRKRLIDYLITQPDNKKFDLQEISDKRTLRANRYYWSLINELANVLKMSKEDLHFKMLQDYGSSDIISVDSKINLSQYFKYYKEIGKGHIKDKEFTHYKIYVESHKMTKKQFSCLLEGLVQECREQNIPTLEDNDLREMIKEYEIN